MNLSMQSDYKKETVISSVVKIFLETLLLIKYSSVI